MVETIVHEATCPVIALIHAPDPDFVKEASKRGVFAYVTDAEERTGRVMERHSIDEPRAFELLREHARSTNRKLVDVASAVVDGHRLLPKQPHSAASAREAS
jgi:AmiR/NasT family two-component response regulator